LKHVDGELSTVVRRYIYGIECGIRSGSYFYIMYIICIIDGIRLLPPN